MKHIFYLTIASALTLLNSIYNGAETGLVALDLNYLKSKVAKLKAKGGGKKEQSLLRLAEKPERYIAFTLIAINASFVAGTTLFTAVLTDVAPDYLELFSLLFSFVLFIFCQLIPKMVFNYSPLKLCLKSLFFLNLADNIFKFPVKIVTYTTKLLMKKMNFSPESIDITREELLILLGHAVSSGIIEEEHNDMATRIIGMRNLHARDIMIPKTKLVGIELSTPINQIKEKILASGLSRFPVYEKEIDNIIGVLYFKDIFLNSTKITNISDIISKPLFVPETKSVIELLREMRKQNTQLVVVLDEYASLSGIISFEDILEEVVGEIDDEADETESSIFFNQDGTMLITGDFQLSSFYKKTGILFKPLNNVTTLNGLILANTGRIPEQGEVILLDKVEFTIKKATQRKIHFLSAKVVS